ncbi:MAG: hypothetical protein ACK4K9_05350 [Bacteroidia bacterium]
MQQLHKHINHHQLRFGGKKPDRFTANLLNVKPTQDTRAGISELYNSKEIKTEIKFKKS